MRLCVCRTARRLQTAPTSLPRDAELPAGVEHGQAVADVELTRPQMLNNLLGRLPFLGHDPDLPRCGPGEQSPWTEFARAGQFVGAWKLAAPIADLSAVLTVFSDGTFTVASDAIGTEPAGMERGTYVYDATTGNVEFTTTVDTNGAFGMNDSASLPAVRVVQATVEESLGQLDFLNYRETPSELVVFGCVRVP